MKIRCKWLWGLLFSFSFAVANNCKSELGGDSSDKSLAISPIRPVVFTSVSKTEIEKTFLQLIEQAGLNPKVPDLRRIRDASKFSLVVPARFDSESGVLHLTYDIYHFKDDVPKAVVSDVEFVSSAGHKVQIEKTYQDGQLLLRGPVNIDSTYTLYASLEGEIVSSFMRFMRPFASLKMSDGSMIPAHNLRSLGGVRNLSEAYNLRRYARFINLKNFLVEACKRYGLYTLLGLTGIRQFFIIHARDRTEDRDEENEKLRKELNELLNEKKDLQITEEKFLKLDAALNHLGREIFEDERGNFYILKKNANHYEVLVEGDFLPEEGSYLENTKGRYFKVRSIGGGRIILDPTKLEDLPLGNPAVVGH